MCYLSKLNTQSTFDLQCAINQYVKFIDDVEKAKGIKELEVQNVKEFLVDLDDQQKNQIAKNPYIMFTND